MCVQIIPTQDKPQNYINVKAELTYRSTPEEHFDDWSSGFLLEGVDSQVDLA